MPASPVARSTSALYANARGHGSPRSDGPAMTCYVIADIGKLKIELHAAEALRKAGQVLDQVSAAPITRAVRRTRLDCRGRSQGADHRDFLLASEKLFEPGRQPRDPARIQPRPPLAQRGCTPCDRSAGKYHAVGAYHPNGTLPARAFLRLTDQTSGEYA